MVKIFISAIFLMAIACSSRELNIDALDLNRYATNLSESQDKFPAYVKLMTPAEDRKGVVPSEVEQITKFFTDKSQPKQLFLLGQLGAELDARIRALALHDKASRLIEIRMDLLAQDFKAQSWTVGEYDRVLEAILKNNHSENTVFIVGNLGDTPTHLFDAYRVLIATTHKKYIHGNLATKSHLHAEAIPLPELMDYSNELDNDFGVLASLLSFAFLPGHDVLKITGEVLSAKPTSTKELVNHVFAQYQAHDETGKNNSDVKSEMEQFISEMTSKDTIQLAVYNMLKFRSYYAEHHKMKHLSYVVRKEFEPELKGLSENQNLITEHMVKYFEDLAEKLKQWTGR